MPPSQNFENPLQNVTQTALPDPMHQARIVRASVVAGVGPFMWVFNAQIQQALEAAIRNFGVPEHGEHRNTAADGVRSQNRNVPSDM